MRVLGTSRIARIVKRIAVVTAAITVLILPFLKSIEYLGPSPYPLLSWVYERRALTVLVLLVTQTVCQLTIWALSFLKRPDQAKLEQALDSVVRRSFGGGDHEEFEYRATLFKIRSFPGLGRWLGMVARSGEKYRRMRTIFSVHHSEKHRNTGVAGECFWRGQTVIHKVSPLEDGEDDEDSRQKTQADYKRQTFLADEEFDRMTMKSCVFLVTCIKMDGKKWGVLVLDSTDPKAAPADNQKRARKADLEHTADLLSMLLK